jgi:iron(III) transport system substrate-binding protein
MQMLQKLAMAAALAVMAVLPAHAQDADWDKIVAAAKAEGSVTFYTSFLGDKNQLALVQKFEDETGIKVNLLDVRVSELEQRLQAEAAAGKVVADVFLCGVDTVDANAATGIIGKMGTVPNQSALKPDLKATDIRTPIYMTASGMLINSNLIPEGQEPKHWTDLLDPKYKGKIIADDFRAQGAGFYWFQATLHNLGEDFERNLAKQDLTFSRQQVDDQLRVARGEYMIKIPQNFSIYNSSMAGKGLPVKMVFPEDGATYATVALSIPTGAPHPNAAKVLINWYLSQEAQIGLTNMGQIPAISGIADKVDADKAMLADMKLFGTTSLATRDADIDLAKQIYP